MGCPFYSLKTGGLVANNDTQERYHKFIALWAEGRRYSVALTDFVKPQIVLCPPEKLVELQDGNPFAMRVGEMILVSTSARAR